MTEPEIGVWTKVKGGFLPCVGVYALKIHGNIRMSLRDASTVGTDASHYCFLGDAYPELVEPVDDDAPEWEHVEYGFSRCSDTATCYFSVDTVFVMPDNAPAFVGRKGDHVFDGYAHNDVDHYGQFVMWQDLDGNLWPSPDTRNHPPAKVTLIPVTATHVRFRVYKNGLPS